MNNGGIKSTDVCFKIMIAFIGFISGSFLSYAWINRGTVKTDYYNTNWKKEYAYYMNVDKIKQLFYDNRIEYSKLEAYFSECNDWKFDYKLYKSYRTEEKSENLKFTYLFQSSRTSELINGAELPEKLKGFMNFSADQKEIKSLILHGTDDTNHHLYHITEFLEVRLYEGEDIVSYIYSPNKKPEQDEYNEMIELENGWYLYIFQDFPIKLKDS